MKDVIPSGKDHTIRIDWKLPARLRKRTSRPHSKQQSKKHAEKSTPHFAAKKIITEAPGQHISLPAHHFFDHAAHPTTADITIPAATFSKPVLRAKPPKKRVDPVLIIQERDVAYHFPEVRVIQPQAKPAMSALFLLIGLGIVSFFVWNLQGAGRGTAVLSTIQTKAANAFSHVIQAQAALAITNTVESERQFSAASQELLSAKADMDEALAASKNILQILDVTGTVKSGRDMLDVGTALADAGVHMSRAVTPFLSVTLDTSLVDAIIASRPHLENAQQAMDVAEEKIRGVETALMPEDIASDIEKLQDIIPQAKNTLHHLLQESDTLLALLGASRDRQYLILFANSDEMRPVGGFIGTVGLVNISRGKVENIDVRSVYDGDGQLKKFLAPPNPLLPIVNRWFLRDSNWFVDYEVSARKAAELFEKEGGPTVDGVITLTPKVIQNLLAVTGPIQVPGYDRVVTAENFIQVTQAEVTYEYDREINKPKQFLSDLTPLLLTKLFSSTGDTTAGSGKLKTLQALTQSLTQKDLLLYFVDDDAQEEAMRLGWAGTLPQGADGFLMVNNANIGGHKSDQFIEQEIDYRATILENGDADVVLTVRREHHGPEEKIDYEYREEGDPALKDNIIYQRTLVPLGATFIEAKGFTAESDVPRPLLTTSTLQLEADPDVAAWQQGQHRLPDGTVMGTESGYTFFANWVVTKPGQTSMTLYHYLIPNAVSMPNILHNASSFALSLSKQPGQRRSSIRASIQLPSGMRILRSVPSSGVTIESDTTFVYRGQLTSDTVPGIVFEKR
ncbi:MAG TPA: DUF4012 domain-containing protein [Candidatus Andersenbacteria bacterium]|nr:DUF4012 domain-containing protein [Candidatus Andersenbacteria bacterium]